MKRLPPLDTHAHVDPAIAPDDLIRLGAVVFAATRSVDDFRRTACREDSVTVWGVGCHPGLVGAQRSFDADSFSAALAHTAFVSEIGLEGNSRVPAPTQVNVFTAILGLLANQPRVVSVHTHGARDETLDALTAHAQPGIILHWWLGDPKQTRKALDLGCYFSVNHSMIRRYEHLAHLPLGRVLTETDHPSGDKFSRSPRQPGRVQPVEEGLAAIHGVRPEDVRTQMWRNMATLVNGLPSQTCSRLPTAVREMLLATSNGTAQ